MLQYSVSFGENAFQKKTELYKKTCEDTSTEEDASDDSEEDGIEAELLLSALSIMSQVMAVNTCRYSATPNGQGYWRISTPPPRT